MYVPTERTAGKLLIMVVLGLFVAAYLIRWVYLDYYMGTATYMVDNPDWNKVIPRGLNEAIAIALIPFAAFFVLAAFKFSGQKMPLMRVGYTPASANFGAFIILTILATLVVRSAYGTSLGEEPADIPLGMGTVVFRAQADLLPGILLLFAEAAWLTARNRQYWFWIAALGAFNLLLALLTTSKAGLIFFAVQLVMLMYLTGQKIIARPARLIFLGFAAIVAFIIAAQLRSQALLGTDAQIMVAITEGRIVETLLEVMGLIVNRLPGVEGLALYCGTTCEGIPDWTWPAFNGAAGQIYTQDVIRVGRDFDFRSPGFIGGAIIIAGIWGGCLLAIGFLRLMLAIARGLDKRGVAAATKIVLVFGFFRFVLEGIWAWQDLASMAAAAVVVEWTARRLMRPVARPSVSSGHVMIAR